MKRIFSCFIVVIVFLLSSCGKKDDANSVIKYLSDLDSYNISCDMTMNRGSKEIKADIAASYLQPSYYKVVFKNPGGYDQIILKNKSSVFVLTPGLDKEFKFNSEWPLNTPHAYLIDTIAKDIKDDKDKTSELKDDILIIKAKISCSNQDYDNLEFSYDIERKAPKYVYFKNKSGAITVKAIFKSFEANPKLTEADFNEEKIKTDFSKPSSVVEKTSIVVGYIIDGSSLKSSTVDKEKNIMCYTGEKHYTLAIKPVDNDNVKDLEVYDSIEVFNEGLIFIKDNNYKYYMEDYQIDIYSNSLDINDVMNIIDGIELY